MRKLNILKFLLLFMCIVGASVYARSETPHMTVKMAEGTVVNVDLELGDYPGSTAFSTFWIDTTQPDSPVMLALYSEPVAREESGRLVVATDTVTGKEGKIWFEAPINSIADISFAPLSSSGIKEIESATGVDVSVTQGKIAITGVDKPIEVAVATAAGISVYQQVISSDTVISLARFGEGIYLVRVGKSTFKIYQK